MKGKKFHILLLLSAITFMVFLGGKTVFAENIDPNNDGSQYAYGENVGWINLQPLQGPGVTVTDTGLTGYAWGENIGWISLSCTNTNSCATVEYGVKNDGAGNLSGYAWGENVGWINFAPQGGGVFIDASGNFNGTAWGENIGWITFRSDWVFITFTTKWGIYGSGDGEFYGPRAIAVDSSGNVYVVDQYNHRIQKFTSNGVFITKWGIYGTGDGEFLYPAGIAVDSSDNVYIADGGNHRIQKFTSDGVFIRKWGSEGSGDGEFWYPFGIAVDSPDNVYVADGWNHRIQKFTSNGVFITKWGIYGTGDGEFSFPVDIAVDSSGNVYVIDTGNNRIQKFTSDGVFITKWGIYGTGDGEFKDPIGIAVDSSDNVYVTDAWNYRIQKFTSDGGFITKWGSFGTGDGEFHEAFGIVVDSSGNVYVADTWNHRIQKFGRINTFKGTNVKVSDVKFRVSLVFTEIAVSGVTTVTMTERGPPPPTGFKLVPLGTYYEITTSATYTGLIQICINYDDSTLTPGQEEQLKLRQYDEPTDEWIEITTSLDTVDNIICGETDHLSFFGVMYPAIIPATVDINPDTMNLKSKGKYITCYIELPEGYDASNIDLTQPLTISQGELSVSAEPSPTELGDFDSDGITDLMVKFDRALVHQMLSPGYIQLTVSGSLTDGLQFEGSDLVNVIDKGKDHADEGDPSSVVY